jgi:hypothetical protein
MACCDDLGWVVVTQPGQLRAMLIAAGKAGAFRIIYRPCSGDVVEHWEHVGWLCVAAGNCIIMVDEIDMICGPGSPKDAHSSYWKKAQKGPALEHIVHYGRHSHLALVAVARAPQDVWLRVRSNSLRFLVFRMDERREMDALSGRLGPEVERLPALGEYQYLDWQGKDKVSVGGGRK